MRIIAGSFCALAAYVGVDAVRALVGAGEADRSIPGIVLAVLSLGIMPFLSAAQRRAGRELGSASAVADSKQTLLCTYLSAVLLVGLVLNATLGWSWADPVAALALAVIAVKEGRDAWQGKGCCAPSAHPSAGAMAGDPGAGRLRLHSGPLPLFVNTLWPARLPGPDLFRMLVAALLLPLGTRLFPHTSARSATGLVPTRPNSASTPTGAVQGVWEGGS
ncbi:cation transporter [Streptomyces sp. AK02-01A]|uniref:cation transporter n=1 Tax=Streptomyces sp. AK02-01A TaxID=3028648 RepID=UPI0039F6F61F